jgi:hypothetical protein
MTKSAKIIAYYLPLSVLILGAALRINVYFQNRSLIIDEANLARYVIENKWTNFYQYQDKKLNYHQYAPPIFSSLSKINLRLLGNNEYALKLPSIIAGILSLVALGYLLHYFLGPTVVVSYILLLFSFSELSVRYSSEFKQYATDTLLAVGFVVAAVRLRKKFLTLPKTVLWAVAGAFSIWASMSIIFILAAIGLGFLWQYKQGKLKFAYISAIGTTWILSFAYYFFSILLKDAGEAHLISYHAPFFFDVWPTDFTAFNKDYQLLLSLFRCSTDQTLLGISWAFLMFCLGLHQLFKKDRYLFIVLFAPILFCFIASGLHFYTLIERLILFLSPFVLLIMAFGLHFLWQQKNRLLQLALVAVMLVTVVNKGGYRYFWTKMEFEDSKTVLAYIHDQKRDATIFVQHDAVPAFVFYNELHDNAWQFEHYYLAKWEEYTTGNFIRNLEKANNPSFWLFLSHTFPAASIDQFVQNARTIGPIKKEYKSVQASAYLVHIDG